MTFSFPMTCPACQKQIEYAVGWNFAHHCCLFCATKEKKMAAPTHNLQVCPFCQITYHITIGHICPIGPKGDVAAWTEERPYDGE